jgi:hypothetical protein
MDIKDTSDELLTQLLSPPDTLPSLGNLSQFVLDHSALENKLPSMQHVSGLKYDLEEYLHVKKFATMITVITSEGMGPAGEDGVHARIDSLIHAPLSMFSSVLATCVCKSARNKVDTQSSGSYSVMADARPDFLFWMRDVLVFRGEEKDADLKTAQVELGTKLVWNRTVLGGLPYIFGYAATHTHITFHALGDNDVNQKIAGPFQLTNAYGRVKVLFTLMQIYRLMCLLVDRVPVNTARVHSTVRNESTGSVVQILEDKVVKRFVTPSHYDDLRKLYQLLKSDRPHIIKVLKFERKSNHVTLEMSPLLARRLPSTETELFYAIKCVLLALNFLHSQKWLHNDIRWPNVLQKSLLVWMLIDMECATPFQGDTEFSLAVQAPEVKTNALARSEASDVFLVGKLLCADFTFSESDVMLQLRAQLTQDDPASRPSVRAVLNTVNEHIRNVLV